MPATTRIGDGTSGICDLGIEDCCAHSRAGTNSTGSPNVFVNGIPAHRLYDFGDCLCPHGGTYASVEASKSVFVNGRGLTRIGDLTSCMVCGQPGSHVAGSPNVFAGG